MAYLVHLVMELSANKRCKCEPLREFFVDRADHQELRLQIKYSCTCPIDDCAAEIAEAMMLPTFDSPFEFDIGTRYDGDAAHITGLFHEVAAFVTVRKV